MGGRRTAIRWAMGLVGRAHGVAVATVWFAVLGLLGSLAGFASDRGWLGIDSLYPFLLAAIAMLLFWPALAVLVAVRAKAARAHAQARLTKPRLAALEGVRARGLLEDAEYLPIREALERAQRSLPGAEHHAAGQALGAIGVILGLYAGGALLAGSLLIDAAPSCGTRCLTAGGSLTTVSLVLVAAAVTAILAGTAARVTGREQAAEFLANLDELEQQALGAASQRVRMRPGDRALRSGNAAAHRSPPGDAAAQ